MSRKESIKLTKDKRKSQICKVYQIKVDYSKLSKHTRNQLKSLFIEGKWLYNSVLNFEDIKFYDTKTKEVSIKVKDTFETRKLNTLSAQMKQGIKDRIFCSILNLSKKKQKGYRVGRLKFTSKLYCIPLKQFNNTYKLDKEHNFIKLQGIKQKLKVSGLSQIPDTAELANSNFIQQGTDYFFHITTYQDQDKVEKSIPDKEIGIDFGCETQLTLSNGIKLTYQVPASKKLKRLDRKIQKKNRPQSKNKIKDKLKREKLYQKLNNKKKDIKNKIVSCLVNNFQTIVFQDESVKAWHSGNHGKKIQNTAIGGIIRDLKHKSHTPIIVNKFFPSTQLCPQCGIKNKLSLNERIYSCECGYTEDRDVKSAKCILTEGLKTKKVHTSGSITSKYKIPTERREFKPREIETSVLTIFSNIENIVNVSFCRNSQLLSC